MAKPHAFVCQACGASQPRWAGRCPECGGWNTLTEEAAPRAHHQPGMPRAKSGGGRALALETLSGGGEPVRRRTTGIGELDRVTGGGLVPGSAILIGGEPGIGKSTLLLQAAAAIGARGGAAYYFTGEEATAQVRLRAARLGLSEAPVHLAAETNLANILATLAAAPRADLVVIDSVQTLWAEGLEAAPGTVSQVRMSTQLLVQHAKASGAALIIVGHVTKEGQIAGPKVIEHMVDTVLYFEGDRGRPFRILRAIKNRFGPTDEIGVFEMARQGLVEVENPSALFLGERERDATPPGSAVFAGVEGTRPLLVEFQALVAPSGLGTPRRAVVGWEASRLAMTLAVLESRCGLDFAHHDVYLNVAGGLRISEPAADLAAAAALVSSLSGVALAPLVVHFGEISLSGSVRPCGHTTIRLKEAEKLGFKAAVIPAGAQREAKSSKLALTPLKRLDELVRGLVAATDR